MLFGPELLANSGLYEQFRSLIARFYSDDGFWPVIRAKALKLIGMSPQQRVMNRMVALFRPIIDARLHSSTGKPKVLLFNDTSREMKDIDR